MIFTAKVKIESIIVFLFSILPIVDSLNGFLVKNNSFSLGTMYKFFLVLFLFIIILRENKIRSYYLKILFLAVGYILFTVSINGMLSSETMINHDFWIKLIFNILLLFLLMECSERRYITGNTIYCIFDFNVNLMILTIIVPYILGIGNTIYAGKIGYKAFYYSQNELAVTLIILFYFCLYKMIYKVNIRNIFQLGGIGISMILLNTKSALVACILGVFIFVFEYLYRKGTRYKIFMFLGVIIAVISSYRFVLSQIQELMVRQNYLYRSYENALVSTLTSGRITYLKSAWDYLLDDKMSIRLIIGNGFYSKHLIEMDFLDVFFYLGLIGLAGLLFLMWYIFKKSYDNFRTDYTVIRMFSYFLVVAYAFFVGHVFFVATSGCYFVLLCCFDMLYGPNINNNGEEKMLYEDICNNCNL